MEIHFIYLATFDSAERFSQLSITGLALFDISNFLPFVESGKIATRDFQLARTY